MQVHDLINIDQKRGILLIIILGRKREASLIESKQFKLKRVRNCHTRSYTSNLNVHLKLKQQPKYTQAKEDTEMSHSDVRQQAPEN